MDSFNRWRYLGGALAITAILLLNLTGRAQAHANLVASDPAAGAVLRDAPEQITMEFTEPLDPAFTSVEVRDSLGNVVIEGPGVVDEANPLRLVLEVASLEDGTYSAVWRARSLVDGHVTVGSVGFSVGEFSERASMLPPVGTPDPAAVWPVPLDTIMRWTSYLALILLIGPAAFYLLVWQPVKQKWQTPQGNEGLGPVLRRVSLAGGILLVVATVGYAAVQASLAAGSFSIPAVVTFWGTRSGLLLAARVGAALVVAGLGRIVYRSAGMAIKIVFFVLSAGLLATFSLQSHSAAVGIPLLIGLDWLHLAAMVIWIGGLLPLFVGLRIVRRSEQSERMISPLVGRFSNIAVLSVLILTLTGLYRANVLAGSVEALTETTYGRMLIAKVALVGMMLALGAVNLLGISPRLGKAVEGGVRWLRRTMRTEIVVALIVLALTGIMAGVAPGFTALDARQREGFVEVVNEEGVTMLVRIAPVAIGDNEFGVEIDDRRNGADDVPATVVLRFEALGQDMGLTELEAELQESGRYTLRGAYFTLPGTWRVTVIARKRGYDDIRTSFDLAVGEGAVNAADTIINPIPPDGDSVARGEVLFQENCVSCHGVTGRGDGPVGQTLNPPPADLTLHSVVGIHSDGQLFTWISEGYPNSAMPAFDQWLSEDQMWDLVNYVRTLSE